MKYLKMSRLDYGASAFLMIYAASAVATPICLIILLKEMDLSLSEGGSIEAVRALLLLGILLYSGIAASRWGKPAVLIAGGFILTGGLFFYGLAPSYFFILAAMTLVGLGGGVLEALINPLIQDLHPENSGAYLNVVNAFFSIGVLGTVLVTGELLTRGATWRMIFLGLGVLSLGVTLFFLSGTLGKASKKSVVSRNEGNPLVHARTLLKKRRFWVFALAMVCGGGVESAYTFWTASFIQMSYGTAPRAGALGTAIFASGMIAGRIAGGLIRQSRIFYQILVSSLAGLLISLGFFQIQSLTGLFFLLFPAGLACACFWPSIQSYAVDRIQGDSTMLFILLSAAGIPGFAVTSWLMGWIGDHYSLRLSFILIPVLFGLLAITMIFERRQEEKSEGYRTRSPRIQDPL